MTLTFYGYVGIHIGCGFGMLIITGVILHLLARYSHDVYGFFMNRMLGVELEYNKKPDDKLYMTIKIDQIPIESKHHSRNEYFLWFIGTVTLTIALMALYEGCILASTGVYIGDDCPNDPMTCFASSSNRSSSEVGTFECVPGNKTTFPDGTNIAWCYGWVVKRQTVSSVINQIGVCGGILGVSGMLFAFMFRSAGGETWQTRIWRVLLLLSIATILAMPIIAITVHISFSVLAYLVVVEVAMLFVTVLIFKQEDTEVEDVPNSTSTPVQIRPVSN
jgi:hypothetical protein